MHYSGKVKNTILSIVVQLLNKLNENIKWNRNE